MSKARGSIWANNSKKKGYTQSVGSYGESEAGDRFFKLKSLKTGKVREYSSPKAAEAAGWYIVTPGK